MKKSLFSVSVVKENDKICLKKEKRGEKIQSAAVRFRKCEC